MRKLILFDHVSLDGFVAGSKGEMDWIIHDDSLMDFVSKRIRKTRAAMYGRKTWEMMEGYWPTAGDQPNAKESTKEHAKWYKDIDKYVLSRTVKSNPSNNVHVIGSDLGKEINEIKNQPGSEILIFGSPTAGHSLLQLGVVDELWMFVNPVLLGNGIPMVSGLKDQTKLKFNGSHVFDNGVVCMSYVRV